MLKKFWDALDTKKFRGVSCPPTPVQPRKLTQEESKKVVSPKQPQSHDSESGSASDNQSWKVTHDLAATIQIRVVPAVKEPEKVEEKICPPLDSREIFRLKSSWNVMKDTLNPPGARVFLLYEIRFFYM